MWITKDNIDSTIKEQMIIPWENVDHLTVFPKDHLLQINCRFSSQKEVLHYYKQLITEDCLFNSTTLFIHYNNSYESFELSVYYIIT